VACPILLAAYMRPRPGASVRHRADLRTFCRAASSCAGTLPGCRRVSPDAAGRPATDPRHDLVGRHDAREQNVGRGVESAHQAHQRRQPDFPPPALDTRHLHYGKTAVVREILLSPLSREARRAYVRAEAVENLLHPGIVGTLGQLGQNQSGNPVYDRAPSFDQEEQWASAIWGVEAAGARRFAAV